MSVQTFLETVHIHRVERLLTRYPKAVDRIFTREESECAGNTKDFHFSILRLASQQSALSDVFRGGHLRISGDPTLGRHGQLYIHRKAARLLKDIGSLLSHEGDLAVAFMAKEATV